MNDLNPKAREQVLELLKLMRDDVFHSPDALWRHYEQLGQVLEQEPIIPERFKDVFKWTDADCICPADGHSEMCPVHKVNSSPR